MNDIPKVKIERVKTPRIIVDTITRMEELLKWGSKVGINLPEGIEFVKDEKKGITAICTSAKGLQNPRISAPLDALITGDLAEKVFGKKDNVLLKVLLAKLKFDSEPTLVDGIDLKAKFTPYLNALPNVVDSPIVWNPREIALLDNTNLSNSLKERFFSILKQWHDMIQENEILNSFQLELKHDIELFQKWDQLSIQQCYEEIVMKTVQLTPAHWCSFSSFLWSHLIFTSRAFPEYVINTGHCKKSSIMLLPIIDLLNHDYTSKVEWSTDNNHSFILSLLKDDIKQGEELFNNYGAKGNEELLNGYGFVLENNICDSVTLRIKLPLPVVENILKTEPSITLPIIDDFTTYAFDVNTKQNYSTKTRTAEDYKDGITFLLQKSNDVSLTSLLQVFTFLSKHDQETIGKSIRPRFEGLQGLRNALHRKLDDLALPTSEDDYPQYEVKEYRGYCAKIYRDSQMKILKHSLDVLKSWEKEWLKDHKSQLLTMDKVLKYDTSFADTELSACFVNAEEDVGFDSTFDLFVLWIVVKTKNNSFIKKHQWVNEDLQVYTENHKQDGKLSTVTEDSQAFYHAYFPHGNETITLDQTNLALNFITDNTFTRSSGSHETILVSLTH